MEKTKKSFIGKIAALLLMLTVVSCCFLGSTFAKYTSSKTGTAEVGVAEWKVEGVSENSETSQTFGMTVSNMSPKHDGATNTVASAGYVITNNSEVDAKITFALGDFVMTPVSGAKYNGHNVNYDTANGIFTADSNTILTITDVTNTIKISVAAVKAGSDVTSDLQTTGVPLEAGSAETIVITVTATWTTQSDAVDTMIGMYVDKVAQSLTVTATQASTVPTV